MNAERNPKGAGRKCSVCSHPSLEEIDRQIVGGITPPVISRNFGLTTQALTRHRLAHMPRAALVEGAEVVAAAEGGRGSGLLASASELRDKAMSLLQKAESAGDLKTALMGVREASRCLELMAKLAGEIDQSATINITYAPVFLQLQSTLLRALSPFPAALHAAQGAFLALEGPQDATG